MFDIQKIYMLPTESIYVFCTAVGRKNSYSPEQHYLLGFITEKRACLLCGVNKIFK
jgi:hypothetical protein